MSLTLKPGYTLREQDPADPPNTPATVHSPDGTLLCEYHHRGGLLFIRTGAMLFLWDVAVPVTNWRALAHRAFTAGVYVSPWEVVP
jgi:hypothetical protein